MNNTEGRNAVPFELPDESQNTCTLGQYAGSWLLLVFHRHLA